MSTRYSLGDREPINLIGLYQREQSAFTRPALGFEATANLIGGANTELHFRPDWVTRLLNRLYLAAYGAIAARRQCRVRLHQARPEPLGRGVPRGVRGRCRACSALRETQWEFGSPPQESTGLEDIGFLGGFDPEDAVALTWQNLVPGPDGQAQDLRARDIDPLIRVAGRGDEPRRSCI